MTLPGSLHRALPVLIFTLAAVLLSRLLLGLTADRGGGQHLPGPDGSVEFLPSAGAQTVAEVSALPDDAWRRQDGPGFVPPPFDKDVWVRVKLKNPRQTEARGILVDAMPCVDNADFFVRDGAQLGGWRHLHSGEWTSASGKALWGRETAFPVTVVAGGEQTVYLHYRDYFAVWLALKWWPEESAFQAMLARGALAEGCYFGLLLALLFYNAVLWARMRFPETGYYLLYLGTFALYVFLGRDGLPETGQPLGSPWMELIGTLLLTFSGVFLAEFTRAFLELPTRLPREDRAVRIVRMAWLAMAACVPLVYWTPHVLNYIVLGSAIAHIVLVAVAVIAWRKGVPQARYFVLAFGMLFAGLLPASLVWLPVFSATDTETAVMIGSALEFLLLSVATAERFARIQNEKLAAQQSLLAEAEMRQTLQEAYADELALEVRERTSELELASADKDRMIAVLGHDLRSPLTGLTQMAEQLAAAPDLAPMAQFVNDTALTGRQMLLLIEDLVLWARLRAGSGHVVVQPARAIVAPAVALHETQAKRSGIDVAVHVAEELWVETDLVLAQTLVRNLLANALKFARSQVVLGATHLPDGVRLTVRDDGPGLPEGMAARLCSEDFGPVDLEGGGLGLRLCREIARAMGRKLEAASRPGEGTEFAFVLAAAVRTEEQ